LFQLISIERKHGEGESILNTILVSYSLYVGIFDYYVRHPAIAFNDLTWGFSSFESIIILFKSLFRNILGISVFENYKIANEYIQKFVPIGRNLNANAYATMYFKFIRDWGYLGIFIGPIFLAVIYHRLNNLIRKNGMYALFYIYSCYMLTQTTNMFSNTTLCYLLVFIYLSLLVKYLPNFSIKYIDKR
jgi:oligosaccharide repeat unit polymerase